jgi:hypothetical protein
MQQMITGSGPQPSQTSGIASTATAGSAMSAAVLPAAQTAASAPGPARLAAARRVVARTRRRVHHQGTFRSALGQLLPRYRFHPASLYAGFVVAILTVVALVPALGPWAGFFANCCTIPFQPVLQKRIDRIKKRYRTTRSGLRMRQGCAAVIAYLCVCLPAIALVLAADLGGKWLAASVPEIAALHTALWKEALVVLNTSACAVVLTEQVCLWRERRERLAGGGVPERVP